MTDQAIRWGILGTGGIAAKFAEGLSVLPDAALLAVGSRTAGGADRFGRAFGVPRRYASYEELAADPEIDVVYISTPHPFHRENTLLCLAAGKAVLCEKPFTLNAVHTQELIDTARAKGLFLMEAMWTRFIPTIVKLRELLAAGVIGDVLMLNADFGFNQPFDPTHRAFDPALGGGALLDVGIYPVSLASMVFGMQPAQLTSLANLGKTGTDDQSAYLFRYPSGALAALHSAVALETPQEAVVMGTKGRIRVHYPFFMSEALTISRPGHADETLRFPLTGNGYNYEAAHVGDCLRAGKRESTVMPLDESLEIMKTLDALRAQWGLVYPGE